MRKWAEWAPYWSLFGTCNSLLSWKGPAIWLTSAVSKLSHMVSFARLPPKFQQIWAQLTDSPLHRRKNIFKKRGQCSTSRKSSESRKRAFSSWRVIHEEMTDIRTWLLMHLGALLCWSLKKWLWLWQSALNDAISLLMRWWLPAGYGRGKCSFVSPPDRCAESRQCSKPVLTSRWLFLSSHYATSCLFNQILIRDIFGSQNTSRPTCHCGPAGVGTACRKTWKLKTTISIFIHVIPWKLIRDVLVTEDMAKYLFFPAGM